jgi:hypothetical protein
MTKNQPPIKPAVIEPCDPTRSVVEILPPITVVNASKLEEFERVHGKVSKPATP